MGLSSSSWTKHSTWDHLERSPIVETVIEIRGSASTDWSRPHLLGHLGALSAEYPHAQDLHVLGFRFEAKPVDAGENASSTPVFASTSEQGKPSWIGVRLDSADRHQVAQFMHDRFAFSRLRPYTNWQAVAKEGLKIWRLHQGAACIAEVSGVTVRAINRIDITIGTNLDDYFNGLGAQLIPFPLTSFMLVHEHADPAEDIALRAVRMIAPPNPELPGTMGLVFDIAVSTMTPFAPNESEIEQRLEKLRQVKNHVFFAHMNPKALELFK